MQDLIQSITFSIELRGFAKRTQKIYLAHMISLFKDFILKVFFSGNCATNPECYMMSAPSSIHIRYFTYLLR
ncbi:hypothetical protein J2T13_004860 [Paenibacillus sp. DS2015]